MPGLEVHAWGFVEVPFVFAEERMLRPNCCTMLSYTRFITVTVGNVVTTTAIIVATIIIFFFVINIYIYIYLADVFIQSDIHF